jgi:hypothetical protein
MRGALRERKVRFTISRICCRQAVPTTPPQSDTTTSPATAQPAQPLTRPPESRRIDDVAASAIVRALSGQVALVPAAWLEQFRVEAVAERLRVITDAVHQPTLPTAPRSESGRLHRVCIIPTALPKFVNALDSNPPRPSLQILHAQEFVNSGSAIGITRNRRVYPAKTPRRCGKIRLICPQRPRCRSSRPPSGALHRASDSVQAQTLTDWEMIIVDDDARKLCNATWMTQLLMGAGYTRNLDCRAGRRRLVRPSTPCCALCRRVGGRNGG